ncbi:MAG: HAMP domain-containing histidine kinase [Candidatus Peribacteraceae bacterium]|nr:HAMP domain-containing histidine kinase [Candidatus Peribacteraceae bacterium]
MFNRISYKIALQFTAFVFLMLFITGVVFLGASFMDRYRYRRAHLEQMQEAILQRQKASRDLPSSIPPILRSRLRVIDVNGDSLYSGELYAHIPFDLDVGMSTVTVENETYDILTTPLLLENGDPGGHLQIADRSPPDDLSKQVILFVIVSFGISFLTFGVGLYFARRSLKPAEQMVERLEQFTQDASHELRTPLTAISTSLDLALATGDFPDNVLSAKKDLKEINILVQRLLELARLDHFLLRKEEVNLSTLVAETIDKHQQFADLKNIVIERQIAPDVKVLGDSSLIRQIVSNLLTNAVKFNNENGTIQVKLKSHTLTVRDTGKGISKDALPNIFNRFYQEDASRTKGKTGLGLGLALVKRIVDLHRWTIHVHSKHGEETTFTIHFSPLKKEKEGKR